MEAGAAPTSGGADGGAPSGGAPAASRKRKAAPEEHWSKKSKGESFVLTVEKVVPTGRPGDKVSVNVALRRHPMTGLTESMEPGWSFTAKGARPTLALAPCDPLSLASALLTARRCDRRTRQLWWRSSTPCRNGGARGIRVDGTHAARLARWLQEWGHAEFEIFPIAALHEPGAGYLYSFVSEATLSTIPVFSDLDEGTNMCIDLGVAKCYPLPLPKQRPQPRIDVRRRELEQHLRCI